MALYPLESRGGLISIEPEDNVFFAVLLQNASRDQAWAVANSRWFSHGRAGYRVPKSCLHITLGGLARGAGLTPRLLSSAMAAADRVRMRAFLVSLNRVEAWGGPSRPTVVTGEEGTIGLRYLNERLRIAVSAARLGLRWAANYTPHLTLLRGGPDSGIAYIEPITWTVCDFALIQSHVGEGRYTTLRRWNLEPPGFG